MKLKIITTVATAAALALGLSACGTLNSKPADLAPVIDALAHAGCSGNLHFGIGATTAAGISPGAAHVENTFDGKCDPRDAAPAAVASAAIPH